MLPPALAYVVLAVTGIIAPPAVAGVRAYASDADLLSFYRDHPGAAHLLAFLVLASAVPFVVFTAVVSHRVLAAGMDVPGRLIALVGGSVAAGMLAVSGLSTLALTQPGVADSDSSVRVLNALGFAAGGPGFVVFSGLLLAGVSIPALVGRLMPRWVSWFGLGVAAVCALATLTAATATAATAATDTLNLLLPVGRFGTMAWMLATALTLPAGTDRGLR